MTDEDRFLDCTRWQTMLEQLSGSGFAPGAGIGLLRKEVFAARQGSLVVLRKEVSGMRALVREYSGEPGADVTILLVLDAAALETLQTHGLTCARALVRQGGLQPYILKTMDQLEAAGMDDFIEDLGLTFPKH